MSLFAFISIIKNSKLHIHFLVNFYFSSVDFIIFHEKAQKCVHVCVSPHATSTRLIALSPTHVPGGNSPSVSSGVAALNSELPLTVGR